MSDRRPENRPLFAGCPTHPEHADRKHDYMGNVSNYGDPCSFQIEPITPEELLAAVRRGVESGTIKGEVVDLIQNWFGEDLFVMNEAPRNPAAPNLPKGTYLVIPVSDGGEDRP